MQAQKKWLIWEYVATISQPNAGATTVGIHIRPANAQSFKLVWGQLGKDDYAADRTVIINHVNSAGAAINQMATSALVDNEFFRFPVRTVAEEKTSTITDQVGVPMIPYPIFGPDRLVIEGAALAQNETITINLRAYVSALPALRVIIGSNATETGVTNRIIGSF